MILFRADGNPSIGAGHIMRCLSLAEEVAKTGVRCDFIMAEDHFEKLIRQRGFSCTVLHTDYRDMESELPWWPQQAGLEQTERIVVDSYFISSRYLSALGRICSTVYLDDLAKTAYPVDTLINYNIYGSEEQYKKLYRENGERLPRLLLGPKYAPLRTEFQKIPPKEIKAKAQDILISTGGSDPQNVAMEILLHLQKSVLWKEARFHVVVGRLNPYWEALKSFSQQNPQVVLHFDVQAMVPLMCSCDLAVSAAGSTLYELCACGVPTVTYTLADNQLPGANAFHKRGLIYNAGDCRENGPKVLDGIVGRLEELWEDKELRTELSKKQKTIVDGKGAGRIAEALLGAVKQP